jgi:glycogen phosphorylase
MEIALHPDIHAYNGGLGVLAGDMARSSADLALPVVFVTLISRAGYVRQTIDAEGRQHADENPWRPEEWCEPLGAMVALNWEAGTSGSDSGSTC